MGIKIIFHQPIKMTKIIINKAMFNNKEEQIKLILIIKTIAKIKSKKIANRILTLYRKKNIIFLK